MKAVAVFPGQREVSFDPADASGVPAGSSACMVGLVQGRAAVQLKAVADARRAQRDNTLIAPTGPSFYQGQRGALVQALLGFGLFGTGSLVTATASDVLAVAQWVDERAYDRRRAAKALSWNVNTSGNGVRDWLEKKLWDTLTDHPDDGSGEVDIACSTLNSVLENLGLEGAAEVNSNMPASVSLKPTASSLRHPLAPGRWWALYYYGFFEKAPEDRFPSFALHEARHAWQFTAQARGAVDVDRDLLFASGTIAASSADLVDAPNRLAWPGGSGDGHFNGDGAGLSDAGDPDFGPVRTVLEHNAMRFTERLGLMLESRCALSDLCIVSGDNQAAAAGQQLPAPVVLQVDATTDEGGRGQSGVTLELVVTSGDALIDGANRAYVMTDSDGRASVVVTNGTVDSEITVEVVAPMAPQNVCSIAGSPLNVNVWVQQ